MQRGRHIDAFVVVIRALETDIFRRCIRAHLLQELRERRAAPASDRAPPFHTDMPRDLLGFRQCVKLWQAPHFRVLHQPAYFEAEVGTIDNRSIVNAVERVEWKRPRDLCFRVSWRETVRIEEPALHGIVQARHTAEEGLYRLVVRDTATGQHGQAAERHNALAEEAAGRHVEFAANVDDQRLAIYAHAVWLDGFHDRDSSSP